MYRKGTGYGNFFILFHYLPLTLALMRILLTSFIILSWQVLKAQDIVTSDHIPSGNYTLLYAEPMALLDGWNGMSARLGIEHAWNNKWAYYVTGGIYFEQGYIVHGGLKRFYKQDENRRYFLGVDYMHNWHIHTVRDYYRKQEPGQVYTPDESRPLHFDEEKDIHTIDLMIGFDEYWRHGWIMEFYAGAGVKFRRAYISIPDNVLDQLYHFHESMIENVGATRGNSVVPDIRMGIRIGKVF